MTKLRTWKCFSVVMAAALILVVGAIAVPSGLVGADEGDWDIQTVDDIDVWSTSLALDSQGNPHIAYTTAVLNSLHYANWTGTEWETEMVDPVPAGVASLALDSHDRPHIAYTSGGFDSLYYASKTGGSWTTGPIISATVSDCSLALDNQGRPHISYVLPLDAQPLRYVWWTGTAWDFDIVDPVDSVGSCSLALDSQDNPHIGYTDFATADSVHYLYLEGSEWVDEVVDGVAGSAVSIALDSQDVPHMSYTTATLLSLHYASRTGGGWTTETVDPVNASDCSLALDSNDRPHISYRVGTGSGMVPIPPPPAPGDGVGAAAPATLGGMLKYANLTDTTWDIQIVDQVTTTTVVVTAPTVGFFGGRKWSSIALDSGDLPHISYGNLGSAVFGSLHYAQIPLVAAAIPPTGHPRPSPTPPSHHPLTPPQWSIQFLNVSPQQASANQPVTITTNVVNTGDEAGNLNVALKINGLVEQSRMVSVGPHTSQPVKFTVTKDMPGTYAVDIADQSGSFTILGDSSTSGTGSKTGAMIALALMGILILASVVVLLARRS